MGLGKMIHEKNLNSKILGQTPFKYIYVHREKIRKVCREGTVQLTPNVALQQEAERAS
jgi:hypothetical protein